LDAAAPIRIPVSFTNPSDKSESLEASRNDNLSHVRSLHRVLKRLAEKAVVIIEPEELCGAIVWPVK
jgi:hypothetical protein